MGITRRTIASKLMGTLLQMLSLFLLPLVAYAQQPDDSSGDQLGEGRSISLTWQRIVAGFILLLIGIILTFRGYRYYRFTMFLAGFIAGCIILYSILTNVEPASGWNYSEIIYLFACIGAGLLLGAFCWLFNRFTTWVLGGLAGLVVALYILAWRSEGLIRKKGGRIGLLVGATALGMILGLFLGRRILIPASAILGAYLTITGIDLFARTGFTESIYRFFTTDATVDYRLTTNLYIMLGVIGGLILLGILFQMLAWRHRNRSLVAQGRTLHDYDDDWTILGRKHHQPRPDPTYASGDYNNTAYNDGYNASAATPVEPVYSEKKSWNPFKKNKAAHTTAANPADYPDNRVSYSSNAALNQ
ncbi:hypothetical protein BG011_008170 [Mortierella polycephala]|uniref:Transmembrane protein 198 n=1 Tax=Mortierella polycephala TaxID=41804 RepID=A0A9P6U8H7_9FUNG|nr:hypothetical protein BG011_008170 [Mortierella polycephala]